MGRSRQDVADRAQRLHEALWLYEQALCPPPLRYAGVDEAGRGCLAGPVYAAAVVLDGQWQDWVGVRDSKQVGLAERERLYAFVQTSAAAVGVGVASVEEIDEYNILHAARRAMGRALDALGDVLDRALVDGPYEPIYGRQTWNSLPVVDGDARCLSIAAASIVAKVERDRYMVDAARQFPEYGFANNAGYGTPAHLQALSTYGPTPIHRQSFAPVRDRLQVRLELG